jgi:glycerophosphoryl diester phosphodiesterase
VAHLAGTKNPLVIAHRGASSKAPENTLAAYDLAWQLGSDAIEIDLRKTKDSFLVCSHDNNLNRVSSNKKSISSMLLSEINEIDVGSWKSSKFKSERVPLLSKVLSVIPEGKKVFLEIKGGLKEIDELISIVKKSKLKIKNCHFLSYVPSNIRRIKKDFPSFKATLNTIPALYNYEIDKIKELIRSTNSDGISLHIDSSESIKLVKKLKKDENFVIAWTVNDSRFMRKLAKWQADGIITDYPQKLLKILNKK